jgi:hypothetical protein
VLPTGCCYVASKKITSKSSRYRNHIEDEAIKLIEKISEQLDAQKAEILDKDVLNNSILVLMYATFDGYVY